MSTVNKKTVKQLLYSNTPRLHCYNYNIARNTILRSGTLINLRNYATMCNTIAAVMCVVLLWNAAKRNRVLQSAATRTAG